MKLIYNRQYTMVLKKALEDINKVNIHGNGFELYLKAFKGKDVYWQVNDLPFAFVQMHDNTGMTQGVSNIINGLKRWQVRRIISKGIPYIREFTVNVTKNKERIKKYFNRESKVLYCGIEPVRIDRNNAATSLRFARKEINLLSSGVFFPYRNYETQIEVVKTLKDRGYNVHLDIIGSMDLSPKYSEKMKELIQKFNLNDNITLCGQVNETVFEELHKKSDIFLFINIDQSWGLAVFEAMSCGLPVIVSESVGATEILENGENALFVKPLDVKKIVKKIVSLTENHNFYNMISDKSREIVAEYTWDRAYSSKMIDIILEK
jgi:glycosyltransferase involved in cell wall biosynthesis